MNRNQLHRLFLIFSFFLFNCSVNNSSFDTVTWVNMITIDGSQKSGSGTIVRDAVPFSVLTGEELSLRDMIRILKFFMIIKTIRFIWEHPYRPELFGCLGWNRYRLPHRIGHGRCIGKARRIHREKGGRSSDPSPWNRSNRWWTHGWSAHTVLCAGRRVEFVFNSKNDRPYWNPAVAGRKDARRENTSERE